MHGAPSLVIAALVSAALAGTGPAVATVHPVGVGASQNRGTPTAARADGARLTDGPGADVISTVAGGVGGPATATRVGLSYPTGVAFGAGHLLIANDRSVREVNPRTDRLTTLAGTGASGPLGDGQRATGASMGALGVATDAAGNPLIVDTPDSRIRVVPARTGTFYGQAMTAGDIYTIAGNGLGGFTGDGGPATEARLWFPLGVAVDAAGNLIIADNNNQRIRVVAARTGTFYGQAMTAGDIYTIAGNGTQGFSGDGGPATSAELSDPTNVAVDAAGNLVIAASYRNNRIRVVAESTGTFYGQAMTAGDIYTIAGNGTQGFSGDGGPATSAALNFPQGVAVDAAGNALIADTGNQRVRVVAAGTGTFYGQAMTAGDIYTVAGNGSFRFSGDGGPATSAGMKAPSNVALDDAGNLLIADLGSLRVRVVAARTGTFYGRAMTAGDIYTIAGNGTHGFSGDGHPALSAEMYFPGQVTVDGTGNLVIADTGNNRIRVVATRAGTFYGRSMTAKSIYTVAGSGPGSFSGDGGPAIKARLHQPQGVAVDTAENLVIADTSNRRIRVVAAHAGTFYGRAMTAGDIYTVAGNGARGFSGDGGPATSAKLHEPQGIAVDTAGNLVIADTGNNRIRVVASRTGTFYGQSMAAGDIYTVAGNGTPGFSGDGGPATSAAVKGPREVAVDTAGNLVIAATGNQRIRVVTARTGTFYGQAMTAGDIYTVAGDGSDNFSGDGGPATSAALDLPAAVALDANGNLVITDTGNHRIRVVASRTGTFYGQAMTAGDIYTVAGNGIQGFSGDGGLATDAELGVPRSVAVDAAGNLLIDDVGNVRIRLVTG
jgi:sugar lactone lactonase YvrE